MDAAQRRLWRESGTARRHLVAAVLLGAAQAGLTLAWAVALARALAAVVAGADLGGIRAELVVLLAAAAGRAALAWAFEAQGRLGAQRVMSELRMRLARHALEARPLGDEATSGELAAVAVQGVDALEAFFARYLPALALAALVPPVVLVWTLRVDPLSALIMAVTIPVIPAFMVLIGLAARRRADARWAALERLSGRFLEVVRGLATLKAYNRAGAQAALLEDAGDRYRRETMGTLRLAFLSALVLELAAALGTALVAVTLGVRLVDGGIGLQAALTVLLLAPELYAPLRALGAQFHATADGLAAAARIFAALDAPPALAPPRSRPSPVPDPSRVPIRLEAVVVRHPGRPAPALAGAGLVIAPGEMVALVGPSGAGKSTLAALLVRLLDPDEGRVLVGGTDLRDLDAEAWRRSVAWVPQRPRLVPGTLRDNLLLADPGAGDERVRAALAAAGAAGLEHALPAGLDTAVGEGARRLSTGEVQRVALARALLRPAPLLVLDEPTASLDPERAAEVAAAVRAHAAGRTALVVAHRPEWARVADRVVTLEHGRVCGAAPPLRAVA